MSKKVILFFIGTLFFSGFHLAHASLSINEIMYDLSGSDSTNSKSREWIEIYNPDTSDVAIDASKWRIHDGSANRTINDQVNFSIPAGAYVIFAGDKDTFLADNPGFGGVVYDTGIPSLNNTGTTLKLLDQDGNTVDSITYASSQGGAGDGNSLQKISGSWVGSAPTPGVVNQTSTSSSSSSGTSGTYGMGGLVTNYSDSSNSNQSTTKTTTSNTQEPKIKTHIIAKNLVFAGIPLSFQATAYGLNNEKLLYGKYFLNFGDGDSKEIQASDLDTVGKLSHTYFYPGDYVVTLEYYANSYEDSPDASDQMAIKVVGADVVISAVGGEKDFFVELTNNTDYSADVSGWMLSSGPKSFTFPKNTIISSKRKMTISPNLTHFSITDKNALQLKTPQGEIIFDYGTSIVPVLSTTEPVATEPTKEVVQADRAESVPAKKDITKPEIVPSIPASDLGASVSSSDVVKNNPNPYSSAIAILFIGGSASAVYFIRRKRIVSKIGDDFKILEE